MKKHFGKILDKKEGFRVIDCRECCFAHIMPLPTGEDLKTFYEKEFYQKEKTTYYFNDTKEDSAWWTATYNNYYAILENLTTGRKILDIGSGTGDFLFTGKKRGWNVLGIEPSHVAYTYSKHRGLAVINDFFNTESLMGKGLFDVITTFMVLEHVPDPIALLRESKKLLKPGGLLLIFSPNDYNPLQRAVSHKLEMKPWWVVPRHHINYFGFGSIQKVLTRLGFRIEESLATFPMEFFLLSGDNYVGNALLGRKCQQRRKKFEMNLYGENSALLNSMYRTLGKQSIGREFMIIARKKR